MMKRINPLRAIFALAVLLLSGPAATADIRDAGDFFSPQAEREANQLMQQIRQRHGKDVVVETVPSLPNVPAGTRERDDFYAAEVARRGREAGVNGLYLLISRQPTYAYAGVDPETQRSAFTTGDRSALRDLLVGRFKQKDYDGGLIEALRMVDQRMAANASGARPAVEAGAAPAASPPAAAERPGQPTGGAADAQRRSNPGAPAAEGRGGMGIGSWLCLIVGAIIIFSVIRMFMARARAGAGGAGGPGMGRPGYDPRTGQPMGGYDPRYGPQGAGGMMGGGGGGMGRGLLGGLLGGLAGGYLYDKMSGPGGNQAQANPLDPNTTAGPSDPSTGFGGGDFSSGGGADLGGGDFGGGGGDLGGGDFGGGE